MWGTLVVNTLIKICPRFIPTHVGNTGPSPYFPSPNSVHPHACGEHTPLVALAVEICPVHPHACGEHSYSSELIGGSAGSSPRMWGTPVWDWGIKQEERFIPTHVGNTIVVYCRPRGQAVHPHACGEHRYCFSRRKKITGSSPRMWGTQILFQCKRPVNRIYSR